MLMRAFLMVRMLHLIHLVRIARSSNSACGSHSVFDPCDTFGGSDKARSEIFYFYLSRIGLVQSLL